MSYEDTNCPCGGKKPTDTMLCDPCEEHLKDRREMAEYRNLSLPTDYRRSAAVILVSLARRRKREPHQLASAIAAVVTKAKL